MTSHKKCHSSSQAQKDISDYIEKYCKKHGVSEDEALLHAEVLEYMNSKLESDYFEYPDIPITDMMQKINCS